MIANENPFGVNGLRQPRASEGAVHLNNPKGCEVLDNGTGAV